MVNRLSEDIENTSQDFVADRYGNRRTSINRLHTAGQSIRRAHGDAAGHAVPKMLHDFDDQIDVDVAGFALDGNCIENFRQFPGWKFNIYDRSDDLYDFTSLRCSYFRASAPPTISVISLVMPA